MSQSPHTHTDRDLLRRIERSAGHRAGYKQLVRELGLGGGHERRLLREQLGRLTGRKELVQIGADIWALPTAIPERTARPKPDADPSPAHDPRPTRDRLVAGRLDLHRDGYGFVRPNGSTSRPTTREDDLFIPPTELNGAMQGDEVLVDEAPLGRDGRHSGRILRVLTRRNPTVVGIFHYARSHRKRQSDWVDGALIKGNYVTPLDERINAPILIPDGAELLPDTPANPNRTLGEEARVAWRPDPDDDPLTPLEGLAVDVEITDFPQPGRPAKGRLLEILGPPDAFGVDVEIIIRKHHLPHVFPANVLAEASTAAAQTVEAAIPNDLARRQDFRHLPIITIDGETARDFDDAVHVRDLPNGNSELQVHIADVSHYVRPASALDLEARLRGTSVYFPDRAVPMLPPELSSGICSLRPHEDRFVQSCIMEIDPHGEIARFEVAEGIIRSAHRMTYTNVQHILNAVGDTPTETDREVRAAYSTLAPDIDRMLALALRLNGKRKRRGSIDFDLPEPVVQFDPQGNMAAIVRSERGWAHRLIEEFMLSANECVATWIERQAVPSLFRIHEMPDPKRIVDFEETAAGFGFSLGIGSLPVKKVTMKSDRRDSRRNSADGRSSRAPQQHAIPERIPVTPQMYQRLTAKIAGTPEERILSYLMLRSLKQARYAEKNEGHFALASPSYTHFTSPIRRYPDLVVHRLLRDLLERGAHPHGTAIHSGDWQPWQAEFDAVRGKHREGAGNRRAGHEKGEDAGPIPRSELEAIATESSQSERRADDAERELIEWKKIKFMQDRVGEDFPGIILSCTKYGFFVELADLFIEGIVPIASLSGFSAKDYRDEDRYMFRDTDRTIVGQRSGRVFRIGQPVRVLLDRIDRQQRRLQFALLEAPSSQPTSPTGTTSLRRRKYPIAGDDGAARPSPIRSGKPKPNKSKKRLRDAKSKGKRRG